MNLKNLLEKLAQEGQENDSRETDRQKKMLNITPDTGQFLSILLQSSGSKRIVEIGTSNGYSTLWLADAARRTGGRVVTAEVADGKAALAKKNFAQSGLEDFIELQQRSGDEVLASLAEGSVDFLFLDAKRSEYAGWWSQIQRVLKTGALLVVDNAVSHAHEIAEFSALVDSNAAYSSVLVPIGKGELVIMKLQNG
jgi:predicted O-methyltransferase YrrM